MKLETLKQFILCKNSKDIWLYIWLYYFNLPINPWGPSGPILISSKVGSYMPGSPSSPCKPGIPGFPGSPISP